MSSTSVTILVLERLRSNWGYTGPLGKAVHVRLNRMLPSSIIYLSCATYPRTMHNVCKSSRYNHGVVEAQHSAAEGPGQVISMFRLSPSSSALFFVCRFLYADNKCQLANFHGVWLCGYY